MSPTKIISAVILIILVGVGTVYAVVQSRQQTLETQAVLVLESGLVSYRAGSGDEYIPVDAEETAIPSGSFIKTEANSYARVFFPDNSLLSIDQETEIQVNYTSNIIDIQQLVGRTWNRVKSVASGGKYEVSTPNTIAAVRGTIFGVDTRESDVTWVEIRENIVEVSSYQIVDGLRKILSTEKFSVGERAEIRTLKDKIDFLRKKIEDAEEDNFWLNRNILLDREFESFTSDGANDFRRILLGNIRQDANYSDYKLGIADIDPDSVKEELAEVFNILKISQDTCTKFTKEDMEVAILKVKRYSKYIAKADGIIRILENLINSCADDKFTVDEAEQLEFLISQFNL